MDVWHAAAPDLPRRRPAGLARCRRGWTLIELLLVLGVLAALLAALFAVYPAVRAELAARREADFIAAVVARYESQYNGSYYGVGKDWDAALRRKAPWAMSPGNWHWELLETVDATRRCPTRRCPKLWVLLHYRPDPTKGPAECQALLQRVSGRFTINGYPDLDPGTGAWLCDKGKGPLFFSLRPK
ncbi:MULTISPECIES: prepilin-type N-terminal cleavage/methylation domain-containing protein [Stenotrophomonas]|uniref:prepilin-type N-terminal cleavage/methylation domain-containing protein n=1 Tax=Stenotrophomonas TaxID=40323 RepID=UPI001E54F123|nr:prepilin-type N-terminal cleavage/methylation domain-containing protein [Stenotrophomonas geniculata]